MTRDEIARILEGGPRLPWGLRFVGQALPALPGVAVTWHLEGSHTLRVEVANRSGDRVALERAELVASVTLPAAGGWFWIHGNSMAMDGLVLAFGRAPDAGFGGWFRADAGVEHRYLSRELGVLHLPACVPPTLLVGSLDPVRYFLEVAVDLDPEEVTLRALRLTVPLEGCTLEPGESLRLPDLLLLTGEDGWKLAERYADLVAARYRPRRRERAPTVWCSWYERYREVSEEVVLANVDAIVRRNLPIDVVQIDDGYQAATGDWLEANARFPSGMAALARRVEAAGKTPGLWLAPFVVEETSALFRERPELLLHRPDGSLYLVETWLGRCGVLDCTAPAGEAWLRHVIETVVREWGYRYLKLDALLFAAAPADQVCYSAPGTTALAHLRRGLEIIRDAAGGEAFLLGCTCYFGAAIGLVDAMRVGPDTAASWAEERGGSARRAIQQSLLRGWMHRRWWWNDPDCIVVRQEASALSPAELRAEVAALSLSGGLAAAGDDLSRLAREREVLVRFLMPPTGVAARPRELGDAPVPRVWRAQLDDERALVGVFQWGEEPVLVVPEEILGPGEVAYDPLRGEVVGPGAVVLQRHDAALWQVAAPGPTPRVVGDTGHVAFARLTTTRAGGQLRVRNDSGGPRTVAVESRGRLQEVVIPPRRRLRFD